MTTYGKRLTPELQAVIVARYRNGEQPKDIAPDYGIRPDSVTYYAKKAGLQTRQPHILHTCDGEDHSSAINKVKVVRLGCGCTRNEGARCDGTPIHWLEPIVCVPHQNEERRLQDGWRPEGWQS